MSENDNERKKKCAYSNIKKFMIINASSKITIYVIKT